MDLRAEKKSLKKLLAISEQQFRIPPYQRPYAWTAEQVDDLMQDLFDSVGSNHFFGSIVVATEDEDRPQVIDGQQRLTTLMILMSVMRDEFHRRGQTRNVQRLDSQFAADQFASGDAYFKFKTGKANWPVFRDFILRGPHDPHRRTVDQVDGLDPLVRDRNRQLLENWSRLRSIVATDLAKYPENDQDKRLIALQKTLLEGVEVVLIEVDKLSDAFLLFETLNDRGLQLSAADLLKSHLLGVIARKAGEEDVDAAADAWDDMLECLGTDVDVSRFLRHYLLVSVPKVKKDDIFGHFKKRVSQLGPQVVLADLQASANAYGEFEAPDSVGDPATRRVLKDLQTLRATTCYIALLPARRYLSAQDFIDYARLAEVLTYRYSSVAGLGTNDLERRYHEAARVMDESKGAGLAESRRILITTMPDSEQFRVSFQRMTMGRHYLLRYTLRKIEESMSPSREKLLDTSRLVHIEHIMPKTLTPSWRAGLGGQPDRYPEYVNRWGNLTLLYSGLNIPASNRPFDQKKSFYKKSQVRLTKRLTNYSGWGFRQIEERQTWLGERADEVWAIPTVAGQEPVDLAEAGSPLHVFASELGGLWSVVEPRCIETGAEDVRAMAESAPQHLIEHETHSEHAAALSNILVELLGGWEGFSGPQRQVLVGSLDYYLDTDDEVPDHDEGGLDDDRLVIEAACQALGRGDLVRQ